MIFWLLDVKSTVVVNGKDVAFDYINTYYEKNDAIKQIESLKKSLNVVKEQLDCTQAMYKNLLEDLEMELYK